MDLGKVLPNVFTCIIHAFAMLLMCIVLILVIVVVDCFVNIIILVICSLSVLAELLLSLLPYFLD